MIHAALSPSSAHRWRACPASVREAVKHPEPASGPAAIDGTHSHSLLDRCVKGNLADPTRLIGVTLPDHEGEFVVDAERAARVKVAIDYVTARVQHFEGACTVTAERRVDPAPLTGRDDLSGTTDIRILSHNGILEIIDYKDGLNPVDADNPQNEQYAIGTLAEPGAVVAPVTHVMMTIIQPKLAFKGMNPISTHTLTVHELMHDRLPKLIADAKATDDPNAPFNPGEVQCKYCPAKGSCAAFMNHSLTGLNMTFPNLAEQDLVQQAVGQDPAVMPDDKLEQLLEAAPLVRQMIAAAEEEVLRRLKAGVKMKHFKLVNGKGSRKWTLPDDEIAEKLIKMGAPKGSVYVTSVVSPAQAEKLVWQNKKGENKTFTDRQRNTIDGEYVAKMTGKLIVVPMSDSRAAVVMDASDMFGALPDFLEELPDFLK